MKAAYVGARPDVLRLVPQSARAVLDVGCSVGELGSAIRAQNPEATVVGIELDREMAAIAKGRLHHVHLADLNAVDPISVVGSDHFDCIILADILEHLVDPWAVLRALVTSLRTDGKVIASIPNVRHIDTVFHLVFCKYWPYRDRGIHDRTHLRFFARRNIVELFEQAGLGIESVERNLRIFEKPTKYNRYSRFFAIGPLRDLLTFQFLITAVRKST